jgi:hypothetical protein
MIGPWTNGDTGGARWRPRAWLVPILASQGIDVGKPDIVEVHNIIRG